MEIFIMAILLSMGLITMHFLAVRNEHEKLIIELSKELTTIQLRLRDLERRKYPYQNISKSTVEDLKATIKAARDNGE